MGPGARSTVYARVTPAHKLRIVRALQAGGAVVAMVGDGVNDAPAIKSADIGIAMGKSGTPVTRGAADMIITDDDFATIVAAVEEGRGVYENVRKTLQYLLAGNTGELLLMTVCVIIGLPAPLVPLHLLWINLVTDGLPALCLATDHVDPQAMSRAPRSPTAPLMSGPFVGTMVLTGVLTAGVALLAYVWVLGGDTPERAQTSAFTVLVFAEVLRAFGARSAHTPLWRMTRPLNRPLIAVVFVTCGLQLASHHVPLLGTALRTVPLPWLDDLALLGLGAVPLVVLELVKVARGAWSRRGHEPAAPPPSMSAGPALGSSS